MNNQYIKKIEKIFYLSKMRCETFRRKLTLIALLAMCLLSFLSCTEISLRDKNISKTYLPDNPGRPVWVAVLPFENHTEEKDIHKLVRESFYSHFSSKNYQDNELGEIDRVLSRIEDTSSGPWKELTAPNLCGVFHADYLIYGKVLSFKRYFLGIYSQIALEVEIDMKDCSTGETLWREKLLKRSHEGGLPFDIMGVGSAALRSGMHMQREKTLELVNRLNRELVEMIPEPSAPPISSFFIDIQIASFLEESRARTAVRSLEKKGFNIKIEVVTRGDRTWHRIISGPYHNYKEAEDMKEKIATASEYKPVFIRRSLNGKEEN